MQKRIYKNIQIRNSVATNEFKKIFLKSLMYNRNFIATLTTEENENIYKYMYSFERTSSKSKVQNLCIASKKPNSTYRAFKLNRTKIKHFAAQGLLPGLRRSS
jgi:ribosomal protein S14